MSFFDSSYFVVIDRRICTRDEQPTGAASDFVPRNEHHDVESGGGEASTKVL